MSLDDTGNMLSIKCRVRFVALSFRIGRLIYVFIASFRYLLNN